MAYTSLQKSNLRRDWDKNKAYTNEVELLECGVKKWAEYFADPANSPVLLSEFTLIDETVIPEKGWGIEMIGYTLPYGENALQVGDHLISRIHAEIPQINVKTWNYNVVRNTYTIWTDKAETMDPNEVAKFYERQLTAFGKSATNWLKFLSYEIFTDLDKSDSTFSEELKNPFFEEFKTEIYAPANANDQGYPFYGVDLALERAPVVAPNHKVNKNVIKDKITEIRAKLTTNKVTYNKTQTRFNHDIPEESKAVFALKEKIAEVSRDMRTNLTKYRLTETNKKGFAVDVTRDDLIAIINPIEIDILNDSIPTLIKPDSYGFTPQTLGVGKVIESPHMAKGTALVIHKDALKLIIIKNEVIEAHYPEHKKINRVHRLGFMLDVFELFPCAFIKANG